MADLVRVPGSAKRFIDVSTGEILSYRAVLNQRAAVKAAAGLQKEATFRAETRRRAQEAGFRSERERAKARQPERQERKAERERGGYANPVVQGQYESYLANRALAGEPASFREFDRAYQASKGDRERKPDGRLDRFMRLWMDEDQYNYWADNYLERG